MTSKRVHEHDLVRRGARCRHEAYRKWRLRRLAPDDAEIPEQVRRARNPRLHLSGFKPVETLADFPRITELEIYRWPLDSFSPLRSLCCLRELRITHFPKVNTLDALGNLTKLESLMLMTIASWYNKRQLIDSFHPLASLTKLRKLHFGSVFAKDKDLSPLFGLKNLRELFVPNIYPQEQLARLAGRLPNVRRDWFLSPFVKMDSIECEKCGSPKVMLSGSDIRPGVICPVCPERNSKRVIRRFEELVE